MKKKFTAVSGVSVMIMTLVSCTFFEPFAMKVHAKVDAQVSAEAGKADGETLPGVEETGVGSEETLEGIQVQDMALPGENEATSEMRLVKVFPLTSGETRQVPRYIVEGNVTYVLDEASIVVEETGRGSSEGADVVTFSEKVENLQDNDLERIEKTVLHDGIDCELLSVVYEVAKEDKNGIPVSYNAVCEYGGLKRYNNSYPTAWQMTAWYDFFGTAQEAAAAVQEKYEYISVPAKQKTAGAEGTKEPQDSGTGMLQEEEPVPQPTMKKFRIKPAAGEEEPERNRIIDVAVPLAAGGTGIALPFIIWFAFVTAPLFALKKEGKYRYIGRIRLKKEDGTYTACLTKRLFAKAEIPTFMIRVPGKVRKKTKAGMLQICCPDEKRILLTVGKEVSFTVEGD